MREMKNKIFSCLILITSLFYNPLQAITENTDKVYRERLRTIAGTHRVIGTRPYQEDTYYNSKDGRFFGVFDGHGGDQISKFLANEFYSTFRSRKNPRKIWQWIWKWIWGWEITIEQALATTFMSLENTIKNKRYESGSTAVVAYIDGKTLYVGNLGDSRLIVGTKNPSNTYNVKFTTEDHKPGNVTEKERIEKYDGYVFCFKEHGKKTPTAMYLYNTSKEQFNSYYRNYKDLKKGNCYTSDGSKKQNVKLENLIKIVASTQSRIMVSRAFGDLGVKESHPGAFIATPDIYELTIDRPAKEFMIIATDGFWDVFDNEEAVKIVGKALKKGDNPTKIAEMLCDMAEKKGSRDNTTVTVVKFLAAKN